MSISFFKDERKVIGTSTVDIKRYDLKINDVYCNDLFKYHRIQFRVKSQHQNIKKIIFSIRSHHGKPCSLPSNEEKFKDLIFVVPHIQQKQSNVNHMELIDDISLLITNQDEEKNSLYIDQ